MVTSGMVDDGLSWKAGRIYHVTSYSASPESGPKELLTGGLELTVNGIHEGHYEMIC